MAGGVRFEQRDGVGRAAGLDPPLGEFLDGGGPQRLQPNGGGDRPRLGGELLEGVAVPPAEGGLESPDAVAGIPRAEDHVGEPLGIHVQIELVADRRGLQRVTDDRPQPGDDLSERAPGEAQHVGEHVGADDPTGLQREQGEEPALGRTREFERHPVGAGDRDGAQQPHAGDGTASRHDRSGCGLHVAHQRPSAASPSGIRRMSCSFRSHRCRRHRRARFARRRRRRRGIEPTGADPTERTHGTTSGPERPTAERRAT